MKEVLPTLRSEMYLWPLNAVLVTYYVVHVAKNSPENALINYIVLTCAQNKNFLLRLKFCWRSIKILLWDFIPQFSLILQCNKFGSGNSNESRAVLGTTFICNLCLWQI